jgi:hypothetical protein
VPTLKGLINFCAVKKISSILLLFFLLALFCSCRNKTVVLLSKKWDCVQVDNIIPPNAKMLSAKDSADAEQLKTLLQSINWTFKNNMRYECAVNGRVTVKGKYELLEAGKIMVCTTESKNSINRYNIKSLTPVELVLEGNAENTSIVLHFKPN